MTRLSDNLTLEEVIKSDTAIRRGIDNTPTEDHLDNLEDIALRVFQPIREHFNTPIYISSGYRSKALNEAIGGSKTSYHSRGMALDIDQDFRNSPVSNADIFNYIKDNLEFSELIWEFGDDNNPAWVHVAFDWLHLDKEVLRSYRNNNKVIYKVI